MTLIRRLALIAAASAGWAAGLAAQSLLDRPPNVSGDWVGTPGTLYFHFVHRFTTSSAPQRKVSNVPTFLLGAGLPKRLFIGMNYSTNSSLVPRYPNEYEFLVRTAPFVQDENAPFDLAGQVDYNAAVRGTDAELSMARTIGPLRAIGAGRMLSNPVKGGKVRYALGGGGVLRLNPYIALAGDAVTVLDRALGEKVAWSAGLHLALPQTPHTLSLQATNTAVGTLQGASFGLDKVRYGFEFTIPLTMRRYVGARGHIVSDSATRAPAAGATPAPGAEAPPATMPVAVATDSAREAARADSMKAAAPATLRDTTLAAASRDSAAVADSAARAEAAAKAGAEAKVAAPAPAASTPAPKPVVRRAPARALRRVSIKSVTFNPGRLEIAVGTTVEWKNNDPLTHSVTSTTKLFESGLIDPGKSFRFTFTKPGTYTYFCTPHPFMTGTVVVR